MMNRLPVSSPPISAVHCYQTPAFHEKLPLIFYTNKIGYVEIVDLLHTYISRLEFVADISGTTAVY